MKLSKKSKKLVEQGLKEAKQGRTVPWEKVKQEMYTMDRVIRRAFDKHPYLNKGYIDGYTILDIFSQGYYAGLAAKKRTRV